MKCSICGQSETEASDKGWPFLPGTDGRQVIEFGTCEQCGSLNVCADCLHEFECCIDTKQGPVYRAAVLEATATQKGQVELWPEL